MDNWGLGFRGILLAWFRREIVCLKERYIRFRSRTKTTAGAGQYMGAQRARDAPHAVFAFGIPNCVLMFTGLNDTAGRTGVFSFVHSTNLPRTPQEPPNGSYEA